MRAWDLHCDTLSVLRGRERKGEPISFGKNQLQIDLEKLKQGGYGLQCLAAFIDLADAPEDEPMVCVLEQADLFHRILNTYKDDVAPVYIGADIDKNAADGKISLMFTVEESGCCKGSLGTLRDLYRLGARMMTLTWNHENEVAWPNIVCDGANGEKLCKPNTTNGLKPLGFEFVAEMERLHMIVDVSHLSDKGFWDVAGCATRPFAASHSNCRSLAGHCRNLTDEMIRHMGEHSCLAGLNYCAGFLEPDQQATSSTVARIAQHAAHFKQVGGIDMIALGSDFDGIEYGPDMQNASELPKLVAALEKENFTESEIEAILWGNARRFFMKNL